MLVIHLILYYPLLVHARERKNCGADPFIFYYIIERETLVIVT